MTQASSVYQVLFFEEPMFIAEPNARLELSICDPGITVARPILPEAIGQDESNRWQRLLLEDLLRTTPAKQRLFWYYTPAALEFSRHLQAKICVFDNMDDLASFRGASKQMRVLEREMLTRADVVFTGGRSLFESKQHLHENVYLFSSSIDKTHFATARSVNQLDPIDQRQIPRPRFGYFGVVDERMDLELLAEIADMRPSWQFVMLGPVAKVDPATLPNRANIHWLGPKSYQELPAYLAGWDVGFMPFALNEATRFISPTKTPEYLAAGVRVISTPIPDVIRPYGELGLVTIVSYADQFVKHAEAILQSNDRTWLDRVDQHLHDMSWQTTWQKMQQIIDEVAARLRFNGVRSAYSEMRDV
jgi:glycosyltransferase involved in cell wall biosynthesis